MTRLWYPCGIAERASFLKSLYEQLGDKSKIQLKKKVIDFKLDRDFVKVRCADGSEFAGSIVVGADGIHSKVREEMQRAGEASGSGLMAEDKFSKCESLSYLTSPTAENQVGLFWLSLLKSNSYRFLFICLYANSTSGVKAEYSVIKSQSILCPHPQPLRISILLSNNLEFPRHSRKIVTFERCLNVS